MYKLSPSFVLGFHGCDRQVGERALKGEIQLRDSTNPYDWLGRGVYFWENNPARALDWAISQANRGNFTEPFVVGAVIDLGYCLDLTSQDALLEIQAAHSFLVDASRQEGGKPLLANKGLLRYLDCQVFEALHYLRDETDQESYDTVRSPFWEGQSLYEGTEFMQQTHIQIAVRSKSAVKGWFRVLDSEGWPIQIQQADEEVEANLTAFPIETAGLDGE